MTEDAAAAQGEPVTTGDVAEPEHDFQEPVPEPVEQVEAEPVAAEPVQEFVQADAVPETGAVGAGQGSFAQGTANESPVLPPSAQAGAAKAHAFLSHLVAVAQAAQAEIEKYVPPELVAAAEREAGLFIRSIL